MVMFLGGWRIQVSRSPPFFFFFFFLVFSLILLLPGDKLSVLRIFGGCF